MSAVTPSALPLATAKAGTVPPAYLGFKTVGWSDVGGSGAIRLHWNGAVIFGVCTERDRWRGRRGLITMPGMTSRSPYEQVAEIVRNALPTELADDVRKNLNAALRDVFQRMDLVTREELAVQEAVLQRTRAKLEQLEAQLVELEQRLKENQEG